VEFFMRIPPRVLYHGDRYKGLLRPVLAKHLPDLGLEEQKKTYPAADQRRALGELRQSLGAAWPDYSFARLGDLGVVDPAAVRREGGRIAEGDFEWLGRMFGLLGAEHWLQARGL
jgi:hypothetical protein